MKRPHIIEPDKSEKFSKFWKVPFLTQFRGSRVSRTLELFPHVSFVFMFMFMFMFLFRFRFVFVFVFVFMFMFMFVFAGILTIQ